MAEAAMSLKEMRAQMAAAAQVQAEERRSQTASSPGSEEGESTASTSKTQGARPVIDGAALRIDDKLRVAKERREEQEKQQASRESQILERERKTRQQYDRQMEERQRKLDEQRRKEAHRRAAAEEKRKQRQEEDKEHYESVLRRSLERSQKLDQRQKRWSWGGGLTADAGDADRAGLVSPSSPIKTHRKSSGEVDKRSASSTNLKQQGDSVISKRLSSSSAALMKFPDKRAKQRSSSLNRLYSNTSQPSKDPHKLPQVEPTGHSLQKRSSSLSSGAGGKSQPSPKIEKKATKDDQARRPPATPTDSVTLGRLLSPTKASLARSKSSAALSAEGSDPQESNLYPRSASASPLHPSRGPIRSRSIDRQGSPSDGLVCNTQKSEKEKRFSSPGSKRPASPSSGLSRRRSPSPAAPLSNSNKRPPSPAAPKQSSRNRPPSPSSSKQRPPSPSPQPSSKPPPIQRPALTPTGPPALRKRDPKPKEGSAGQTLAPQSPDVPSSSNAASSKTKDDSTAKGIAGTTSAETAAKTLSENRRLAREQKEREELLRVQREEEERLRKEEEKRLLKEKRARQAEEEKMRAEQRKVEEEERARVAEEERERLELEEQERQVELQREREEAEVRALEEAEKQRQERARIMQQNQQERMARRKRIEEIMKRTRKTDQNDFKRDEEKGMLDENEEEDSEAKEDGAKEEEDDEDDEDCANSEAELEAEGWSLPGEGPMAEREGSVNGELAMDNKEYRSVSVEDAVAVSLTTKVHLVEGSEFVNEDSKMGMLPGLNGKVGSWSFEELIDLGVHPRAAPLISAAGGSEKPRVAFEDKGGAVTAVHPGQPVEPLSEM